MFFKSIFSRLFFTVTTIIVIVVTIVSLVMALFMYNYTVNRQIQTISELSETVELMTGAMQIQENDNRTRQAFGYQLEVWSKVVHADIIIVNLDGDITEKSTNSVDSVPQEMLDFVLSGDTIKKTGDFNGAYDEKVMTVGIPVYFNGNIVGGMFFNSMVPRMKRTFADLQLQLLSACLISMAVACILVYLESRKLSRPINRINSVARDIAAGNFGGRVRVDSMDEIGQLAASFNFMADSIEDLENQRSSFVSDVSHELRTPMTSITGFVQSILDGTIPEEKREYYLKIVLDESKRLTKLVNDMLDMSRMSSDKYQLTIEAFDLNELVRVAIVGLYSKIEEHNLDISFNGDGEYDDSFDEEFDEPEDEPLMVIADKDSIKRVLINIIDNAIKFSYPNTVIGINTWVADKKAHVSIGNFGIGIDGADLSNVFNRFYKTDRSRGKERSGAGLGLSLVKNILTLHKQSIWVESVKAKEGADVKYTKFTFTLELA
ncbi:MAG: HAMP domain-containing sensor histidine kinase [bacterium]|nr:HAMP domain-containing sensor histidine kinase [bacterium]